MTTGYLFFDNSKDSLEKKVLRAVEYHVRKTGFTPSLCLVHTGDVAEGEFVVTVRPYRSIPKFHLWVGMEDDGTSH